jgi:hypothetical protein
MQDYNHNGKFDKEDFLIAEDDEADIDNNASTTAPAIVVFLIIVGIIVAIKIF